MKLHRDGQEIETNDDIETRIGDIIEIEEDDFDGKVFESMLNEEKIDLFEYGVMPNGNKCYKILGFEEDKGETELLAIQKAAEEREIEFLKNDDGKKRKIRDISQKSLSEMVSSIKENLDYAYQYARFLYRNVSYNISVLAHLKNLTYLNKSEIEKISYETKEAINYLLPISHLIGRNNIKDMEWFINDYIEKLEKKEQI